MTKSIYGMTIAFCFSLLFFSCEDETNNPGDSKIFPTSGTILNEDQLDEVSFKWDTEGLDLREDIPQQFRLYELEPNSEQQKSKEIINNYKLVYSAEITEGNSFKLNNKEREFISNNNIYVWQVSGLNSKEKLEVTRDVTFLGAGVGTEEMREYTTPRGGGGCYKSFYDLDDNCKLTTEYKQPCVDITGTHWVTKFSRDGKMKFGGDSSPSAPPRSTTDCINTNSDGTVDIYGTFAVMVPCASIPAASGTIEALLFKGNNLVPTSINHLTKLVGGIEKFSVTDSSSLSFDTNDYENEFCNASEKVCFAKARLHLKFNYIDDSDDYNIVLVLQPFTNHPANQSDHIQWQTYSSLVLGGQALRRAVPDTQQGFFSRSMSPPTTCNFSNTTFAYYECLDGLDEATDHRALHVSITNFSRGRICNQ